MYTYWGIATFPFFQNTHCHSAVRNFAKAMKKPSAATPAEDDTQEAQPETTETTLALLSPAEPKAGNTPQKDKQTEVAATPATKAKAKAKTKGQPKAAVKQPAGKGKASGKAKAASKVKPKHKNVPKPKGQVLKKKKKNKKTCQGGTKETREPGHSLQTLHAMVFCEVYHRITVCVRITV